MIGRAAAMAPASSARLAARNPAEDLGTGRGDFPF
jgi:hypothetical protein